MMLIRIIFYESTTDVFSKLKDCGSNFFRVHIQKKIKKYMTTLPTTSTHVNDDN